MVKNLKERFLDLTVNVLRWIMNAITDFRRRDQIINALKHHGWLKAPKKPTNSLKLNKQCVVLMGSTP